MTEIDPSGSDANARPRPADVVAALDADPPPVHVGAPTGVWAAAHDCLEFLGTRIRPGFRTLETGCGASTIMFAAAGSEHTAVFLNESEGTAVTTWCAGHDIDTSRVTLRPGSSSQVLPALDPGPLDLVLVDGCHGFPFPQLDWYYAAAHLVDGGILVVDDTQLPAPYELGRYLEHDPRWERIHVGSQWVAFKRLGHGSLDEEWTEQRFHQPAAVRVQGARRRARGTLGRLRRSLRG
jgi:predicted O-methyltransferase YrrM